MGVGTVKLNKPSLSDPSDSATNSRRTVVFTDVVGSTEVVDRLGDQCWFDIIVRHHGHAHVLAQELGAERVASTGDGVLVVFEDSAAALCFGLEMLRRVNRAEIGHVSHEVQLHVGIATGPVRRWNDDYFGRTMHLAARLSTVARPGELLLDEHSAQAVQDSVGGLCEHKPMELRGFESPERVYSLAPGEIVLLVPRRIAT